MLGNDQSETRFVTWSFLLLGFICILLFIGFGYLHKGWIYGSDAQYYYSIGRSMYFDHDFDFTNELRSLTPHPEHFGELKTTQTGYIANKYPVGYAILSLPFFLIADIFTYIYNHLPVQPVSRDGYVGFFRVIVPLGTLFYAFCGIYFTNKFLRIFYSPSIAALAITTTILSTSILWYVVGQVTMVHVHSFAFVSFLTYLSMPLFRINFYDIDAIRYVCIGAILALIGMIRLQDLIFILIPAIPILKQCCDLIYSRKYEPLKKGLFKIIIGFVTFAFCFSPQAIYWKVVYGHVLINTYADSNESFNFFQPELFNVLFSTNHGLFLWSPLTLFALIGSICLFKRMKDWRLLIFSLLLSFGATWYILSSWHDWPLGYSFGARGFNCLTVFFCLGWGEILFQLWRRRAIAISACALIVFWNLQLLMQQRYFGWIPFAGEFPLELIFQNMGRLPGFIVQHVSQL